MAEKSKEYGSKSSVASDEIFICPECESENMFQGHKGETVTCSSCGLEMKPKSRQPEDDFFVCPECDSELEAPGHKGEPVVCPTCGVKYSEEEARRPA